MEKPLSRRMLLGAALATGAIAGAGLPLLVAVPMAGLALLSAPEVRVVEALAGALFPPGYFPVAGGDGGTAPAVDRLLHRELDGATRDGFRALLAALELGTLASRGLPFSALPRELAADVLDVWAREDPLPRRLADDALRLVVSAAFLRRPEVLAAVGWRRGCA